MTADRDNLTKIGRRQALDITILEEKLSRQI